MYVRSQKACLQMVHVSGIVSLLMCNSSSLSSNPMPDETEMALVINHNEFGKSKYFIKIDAAK